MVGIRSDMTTEQVMTLMGPPDKIELYRGKNNEAVLIYLYVTEYTETYTSRGWNKNIYTSFIFVNDRFSGSSWHHLDTAAKRYEFVIRPPLATGR